MKFSLKEKPARMLRWAIALAVMLAAALTWRTWWKPLNDWVRFAVSSRQQADVGGHSHDHGNGEHGSHSGHSHAGHDDASSLELTEQAMRNLGLTGDGTGEVRLSDYTQAFTVPAVVTEQPGRTQVHVTTPMTGIVTSIHAVKGEAVFPGSLLFAIRLTHEDLVTAQTDFIRSLGELDIEEKEIERLSNAARDGGIARKILLEREYERDKLAALLVVQREALRLHGLTELQVNTIEQTRRLMREMKLYVPDPTGEAAPEFRLTSFDEDQDQTAETDRDTPLILRDLLVHRGEAVQAGTALANLVSYSSLYIEGQAFEQDVVDLQEAHQKDWTVTALIDQPDGSTTRLDGLKIAYLDSAIDEESRTLHFYVELPNEVVHRSSTGSGAKFISWKYRPGQRLQLSIPVKRWEQQIVLPIDAVAREGAEYFVFQQNGDHFDRVPVHVKFRDQYTVVIANDGQLFPGDIVALRGAHQLQMALKNKAGGGVDPHAGHTH